MIIVIAPVNPLNELCSRFWFHEYKRPYYTSVDIKRALDEMEVSYSVETPSSIYLDMTKFFAECNSSPHKLALDFIAQTKLSQYPDIVTQICVDYLKSIAHGKPRKYLIDPPISCIIVEHKQKQ